MRPVAVQVAASQNAKSADGQMVFRFGVGLDSANCDQQYDRQEAD